MQNPQLSEPALYFYRKTQFLLLNNRDNLLHELHATIQSQLLRESDSRLLSPAILRALSLDLSYLLLRHRGWLHAALVSELAIDFIHIEYLIPRDLAGLVVEHSIDLLHHSLPAESNWDAERYDEEFLEHLFICSILARSEHELAIDIGFGRNMIELLSAAVQLNQSANEEDVFHFAPELVKKLSGIIQRIMNEHQENPWILGQYQLKNHLQRDPYTRKSQLTPSFLQSLLDLMIRCGADGIRHEALSQDIPEDRLNAVIPLLLRTGLIFEIDPQKGKDRIYQLSKLGQSCSSLRFAYETINKPSPKLTLRSLPAHYQAGLVQLLAEQNPAQLDELIRSEAASLSPEALRIIVELWQKQKKPETLLELFEILLHNQAHAWMRAEICHALPLAEQAQASERLLKSLAQNDQSPMVRNAAREALKRPTRGHEA